MYVAPKYVCSDCDQEKIIYDFYQDKYGRPSKRCRECQRILNKTHPSESERLRKCAPEPAFHLCIKKPKQKHPKKNDVGFAADGSFYQF